MGFFKKQAMYFAEKAEYHRYRAYFWLTVMACTVALYSILLITWL